MHLVVLGLHPTWRTSWSQVAAVPWDKAGTLHIATVPTWPTLFFDYYMTGSCRLGFSVYPLDIEGNKFPKIWEGK